MLSFHPATPVRNYQSHSSSPLSPLSSPLNGVTSRRAYKSHQTVGPQPSGSGVPRAQRRGGFTTPENARNTFFRERFIARCQERAKRERAEKISRTRRWGHDSSSDGFDMEDVEMEQENDEDDGDDELLRRIIASEKSRARHALRVSYEREVGSSFDPIWCDAAALEQEWLGQANAYDEPPPEVEEEEDFYEQYENYLQSLSDPATSSSFGDIDMDDHATPRTSSFTPFTACPRCSSSLSNDSACCAACNLVIPYSELISSWDDSHGHDCSGHSLLSTSDPDGVLIFCSAPECCWAFAL